MYRLVDTDFYHVGHLSLLNGRPRGRKDNEFSYK